MAIKLCAGVSLVVASLGWRFGHVGAVTAAQLFIAFFALLVVLRVVYNAFIYPRWLSPLRHLPTPEVREALRLDPRSQQF